jgi:hypothetical protein
MDRECDGKGESGKREKRRKELFEERKEKEV